MDRALDAALSRALGYYVYCHDVPDRRYYSLMSPDGVVDWPLRGGERTTEAAAWNDVPYFGSTGDGMLQVVEAMRARGFYFELGDRFGDDGEHPHAFYATFEPLAIRREREEEGWLDQPDEEWWRWATTAPMAVALACLAALGVEVATDEQA